MQLIFLHVLHSWVSQLTQQWAHTFSSLHSVTHVLVETFLVVFDLRHQI